MAFVWIQVWGPLPTIYEGNMTDTTGGSQPVGDLPNSSQGPRQNVPQLATAVAYDSSEVRRGYQGPAQSNVFQGSYQSVPSFPPQQNPSPGRQDSFGMTSLGSALPEVFQGYGNMPSQRYSGNHPASAHQFHPQVTQFTATPGMTSPTATMPYNVQYQSQYQGMYAQNQHQSPPNPGAALGMGNQFYQGQSYIGPPQQTGPPYFVQSNQFGAQNPMFMANHSPGHYGIGRGFVADNRFSQQRSSEYLDGHSGAVGPGRSSSIGKSSKTMITQRSYSYGYSLTEIQHQVLASLQWLEVLPESLVKAVCKSTTFPALFQELIHDLGHAIWIGNLPPHTDLMSLVLHVCKETPGLESLFLISKSNCAFANFKDEESCAAAQIKIHDSRFQTVRLVSRLRRSSGAGVGAGTPTGPAALTPPSNPPVARTPSPSPETESKPKDASEVEVDEVPAPEDGPLPKDKFFVVKSLTVEDLELSVRNGIWATQSHNEDVLNKAYKVSLHQNTWDQR